MYAYERSMNASLVTFPTNAGEIVIEFAYLGPADSWIGPGIFLTVDRIPVVSVVMRDGCAVIDILGTDPSTFDSLPSEVKAAARFWRGELTLIHRLWESFVARNNMQREDAA